MLAFLLNIYQNSILLLGKTLCSRIGFSSVYRWPELNETSTAIQQTEIGGSIKKQTYSAKEIPENFT